MPEDGASAGTEKAVLSDTPAAAVRAVRLFVEVALLLDDARRDARSGRAMRRGGAQGQVLRRAGAEGGGGGEVVRHGGDEVQPGAA